MRIGRDHHRRRDRRQPGGRQIMPRWPARYDRARLL